MKDLFRTGWGAAVVALALTATPAIASGSPVELRAAASHATTPAPGTPQTPAKPATPAKAAKPAPNPHVSCPSQQFSQPFLALHDRHWYTLLPGESADSFDGTGWALTGKARVTSATLKDGHTGQVLELSSGGKALSPVECVDSAYPQARTLIDTQKGRRGVSVYVSFYEHGSWTRPAATGNVKSARAAWQPSVPMKIHAQALKAQTPMRFVLLASGSGALDRVYDFYLDPRLSW